MNSKTIIATTLIALVGAGSAFDRKARKTSPPRSSCRARAAPT